MLNLFLKQTFSGYLLISYDILVLCYFIGHLTSDQWEKPTKSVVVYEMLKRVSECQWKVTADMIWHNKW